MNDLDDLIRRSLHEHAPAVAPDPALAARSRTTGRRIRGARTVGGITLELVVVAGLAWIVADPPGLGISPVVASPAPATVTTSAPPTPSASGPTVPTTRDVSTTGAVAERDSASYLVSFFASPTGDLHCFISTAGAGCQGAWAEGVQPAHSICKGEGAVLGPEVWGRGPAKWECGTDPHSLPFLYGDDSGDETAWWDSGFGAAITDPDNPDQTLAVLPNGRSLVAGDFTCTTAGDGVTCTNSRTGEGFRARTTKVTLTP